MPKKRTARAGMVSEIIGRDAAHQAEDASTSAPRVGHAGTDPIEQPRQEWQRDRSNCHRLRECAHLGIGSD